MDRNNQQYVIKHLFGMDLKAAGGTTTLIMPAYAGRFMVTDVLMHVATLTGVFATAPTFKIGNNAGHDNVVLAGTVALGSIVNQIVVVSLVAVPVSIDLTAAGLSIEMIISAGATTMTGDLHIEGYPT